MKIIIHVELIYIVSVILMLIPVSTANGLFTDIVHRTLPKIISENAKPENLWHKTLHSEYVARPYLTTKIIPTANNDNNNSVNSAHQNAITYDPGFGCGNKYWGIKNYQNADNSKYVFGRNTNCNDNPDATAIPDKNGIKNYVKLISKTQLNTTSSIAWQATMQGITPWGHEAQRDGGALNDNNRFQLSPDLNYQLNVQYLWFDDEVSRPQSENDNVKANILVDLWFADTQSQRTDGGQYKNVLVIDLAFANLENKGGKWRQDSYLWEGTQYYRPFAERNRENGQVTYFYSSVLDTDGKNPMVWYSPSSQYTKTLKDIINDAFTYNYKLQGENTTSTPVKSNYKLVDLEAGAEVSNAVNAKGTLVIALSECKLSYIP